VGNSILNPTKENALEKGSEISTIICIRDLKMHGTSLSLILEGCPGFVVICSNY